MQLARYLDENKITQGVFADQIGVTQGRVSQLVRGAWLSRDLAAKIKAATNGAVTADDFLIVEIAEPTL